jgi:toxin-antitoxin system PIN domain toxin
MQIPDVNILVSAFRPDAQDHKSHLAWLDSLVNSGKPFGVASLVLSGFLRVVTNPRVFRNPDSLESALAFVEAIRSAPTCFIIDPGPRHWTMFTDLCRQSRARGNLVPDAYLAALAIESGSEWITMDGDYARFPGLKWRRPF